MQMLLSFAVDNKNAIDFNKKDKTRRTGYFHSCFYPSGNRQTISKMLKDNAKVLRISTDDQDEFTLRTGDEWRKINERHDRSSRQPSYFFICYSTCCQKYNPYPRSFARSQTPRDGFWNPIIGYGTVYEEEGLINDMLQADSSDDSYLEKFE